MLKGEVVHERAPEPPDDKDDEATPEQGGETPPVSPPKPGFAWDTPTNIDPAS